MRAREYDLDFRDKARRTSAWGMGLLVVAALLWIWCALLLLASWDDERDWPEALAVLGLSVPVSVAGAVLFTVGWLSRRMSAHGEAMRELDKFADAPRGTGR
ncbi:hypothetical protein [Streptomyces sp. CC208A]|uniref:hypothetical protein n=1 Tax=Streptomyces sp. CC208A TaxID=3044573 RepID=UPI0024A81D1E|nr:hypothetical protein [Streptomyces sp. CC208A]